MNSAHKEVRNPTNLVKTTRRRLLIGVAALTVLIALAALGSPATAFAQDSTQSKAAKHRRDPGCTRLPYRILQMLL
jgi:hypothetical protein